MKEFLERLASKSPTPGGGSVAALMGSLGYALLSMVCNLTIGKERYREVEEEIKKILSETEEKRRRLELLMEEDAKAFEEVMAAYKMEKGVEREKAIQKALLQACRVPLETMRLASMGLHLAESCARKGNRNALSDVGVGALALHSAIQGGALNIKINLISLKEGREEIEREMEEILQVSKKQTERVMEEVEKKLQKS